MHIEIRKRNQKKLYYLAHSFRDNGSVRKVRKYLGVDLDKKKIEKLRKKAEKIIKKQIEDYKIIRDPLHTVLNPEEIKRIQYLVNKKKIRTKDLNKKEWKKFTELFTYNTNAIEGSTVELSEVRGILEKDKWPDKSKEEISETYGVSDSIEYIRKTKDHLSLGLMKELHKIVFRNSKSFAGKFRGKGIEVAIMNSRGDIVHRGAPQTQVLKLLKELTEWYNRNKNKYHPIVLAAVVHNQFENIHPFQDGNRRVGRLILNNILLKHNFPPVNITLKNRTEYYSTIREYEQKGNLRPTIELILKSFTVK